MLFRVNCIGLQVGGKRKTNEFVPLSDAIDCTLLLLCTSHHDTKTTYSRPRSSLRVYVIHTSTSASDAKPHDRRRRSICIRVCSVYNSAAAAGSLSRTSVAGKAAPLTAGTTGGGGAAAAAALLADQYIRTKYDTRAAATTGCVDLSARHTAHACTRARVPPDRSACATARERRRGRASAVLCFIAREREREVIMCRRISWLRASF